MNLQDAVNEIEKRIKQIQVRLRYLKPRDFVLARQVQAYLQGLEFCLNLIKPILKQQKDQNENDL